MDTRKILDRFYSKDLPAWFAPEKARPLVSRVGSMARNFILSSNLTWYLVAGSLLATFWIVVHLYYYNILIDLEFNVKANWAQVEVQLQRRFQIQKNLTQVVIAYSQYEKDTFIALTKMRTQGPGGDLAAKARNTNQQRPARPANSSPLSKTGKMTPLEIEKMFPTILLTAEQYPDLKLTENFQQISAAIIDTENLLAEQIIKFNDSVNIYTTTRKQFPANIFGWVFGFKMYEYYVPDKKVMDFQIVKY